MSIRLAQPADAPAITGLLTQLDYPGTEGFLPARLSSMLTDPAEILLVWAEAQPAPSNAPPQPAPSTAPPPPDRILALLSLHFIPQIALKGDFARISYFTVDEQARSMGIGQQLEAEATRLAKERGCHLIEVHCHSRRTRAHAFYARQGYSESPKYLIKRLSW